jgi:predicted metal-dependent hydrolase
MTTPGGREYTVRRSDRARRARLTVNEAGDAVVVLPRRATLRDAAALVEQHGAWIDRHVAKARVHRARIAERPRLGEGRTLDVDGEPLEIVIFAPGDGGPLRGRVTYRPGCVEVRLGHDGRETPVLLEAWLRTRARSAIEARVAERAPGVGVMPGRISIRDQTSRWASASADGKLSFSWRLILAPPSVLDAVVVHELAHLRIRGHSPAFWALVEGHAPQTPAARRWLREHARDLRAALSDV